jgi:hypothetical protein
VVPVITVCTILIFVAVQWDTMTFKNLKTKFPDLKLRSVTSGKTINSSLAVDMACTEGASSDLLCIPEHNKILMLDIISGWSKEYWYEDEILNHRYRIYFNGLCFNIYRTVPVPFRNMYSILQIVLAN